MLASAYGAPLLPEADPGSSSVDVTISIRVEPRFAASSLNDRLVVRREAGVSIIESDPLTGVVRADVSPADVAFTVHDPALRDDGLAYHFWILFNRALLLLDRMILHAAALRYRNSVSLFAGPKGAGKSTISAALGGAGAELLADDHVLARRVDSRTMVSGCNGRMRVTAKTERFYLDGRLGPETIDVSGVSKKEFPADRFFAVRAHEARVVDRLFFPHVGTRFAVRRVTRQDALLRLMAINGSMLRFHARSDYADFLARLTDVLGSLPAYDLELSPSLDELDRLVSLLDQEA